MGIATASGKAGLCLQSRQIVAELIWISYALARGVETPHIWLALAESTLYALTLWSGSLWRMQQVLRTKGHWAVICGFELPDHQGVKSVEQKRGRTAQPRLRNRMSQLDIRRDSGISGLPGLPSRQDGLPDCVTVFQPFFVKIVKAFQAIGVGIIAQGLETLQSVEALQSLGIEMMQGYYFGFPCASFAGLDHD